jgi:L-iditol 2-dehydrogenase
LLCHFTLYIFRFNGLNQALFQPYSPGGEGFMRVAMYYSNQDVRLEEMPTPQISPGEVLMRVEASGICGTDLLEWYRRHKAPLVLGHEVAGVITAVGDGVERYKEGDRICAAHHVPCNTCHYCLSGHHTVCDTLRQTNFDPGGFAEYIRLPHINVERGVFLLPENVSFEEGTFVEPLACVLRGQRLARLEPGQTVLVIGSGVAENSEPMLPFTLRNIPRPICFGRVMIVSPILSCYAVGRHPL